MILEKIYTPTHQVPFLRVAGEGRRGHMPQHLSLSAIIHFQMILVNWNFLKPARLRKRWITFRDFRSLLEINKLCVQLINCFTFYIIVRIVGTETNCFGVEKSIEYKRWEKSQNQLSLPERYRFLQKNIFNFLFKYCKFSVLGAL